MTEKQALEHVLEYAQGYAGDTNQLMAARAVFVVLWLEDKNWHRESAMIADMVAKTPHLAKQFKRIEADAEQLAKLENMVSTFNHIFGWGLKTDEWKATQGLPLVNELWEMIFGKRDSSDATEVLELAAA